MTTTECDTTELFVTAAGDFDWAIETLAIEIESHIAGLNALAAQFEAELDELEGIAL